MSALLIVVTLFYLGFIVIDKCRRTYRKRQEQQVELHSINRDWHVTYVGDELLHLRFRPISLGELQQEFLGLHGYHIPLDVLMKRITRPFVDDNIFRPLRGKRQQYITE